MILKKHKEGIQLKIKIREKCTVKTTREVIGELLNVIGKKTLNLSKKKKKKKV